MKLREALELRNAVASISPEQAQKSHECERTLTHAPTPAWGKERRPLLSWFRGPLRILILVNLLCLRTLDGKEVL